MIDNFVKPPNETQGKWRSNSGGPVVEFGIRQTTIGCKESTIIRRNL
jgi:hypothetical protein